MKRRTSVLLATLALLVSGLAAVSASTAPSASAITTDDVIAYCAITPAPPCIVSFTHNGSTVDPTAYRIQWNEVQPSSGFYSWYFSKFIGASWSSDMGADETANTFAVKFDFGSFNPRTIAGLAAPRTSTAVVWSGAAPHYLVQISESPVHWVTGCVEGNPTPCPMTGSSEAFGYLSGVANDGRWFGTSEAEHQQIAGFYTFSNTDISDDPVITTDAITGARTMVFVIQSPHESPSHALFYGNQYLRIPNRTLHDVYGIPAPATMTAASLGATISSGGSGTITVTPEAGHGAMLIAVTNVTFSKRSVKVRLGTITPARPSAVKGKRLSPTRGRVTFGKSAPRGAYPTGYQLRCVSGHQVHTATGSSSTTRFRIRGLTPGRHYTCRVRAKSHVGPGPWSYATHL